MPALLRANGISAGTHLLAGTRLLVPTHRVSDENLVEQFDGPRLYQQVDAGPLVHRVRRGETGASIARRYGLTLAELRAMNRRVSPLKPGMTLTVRRSQKQTVLVAEDGSRKVISRQATVPATATASSGSHTAIRLVHYSPARTQTAGSSNTAASRSTASRLDSRVTLRSDRSATRHTLRQSGKTTVALADTTSRSRSAAASTSTRSTTHKSTSATTTTGKRLKAASASSATSRGSASSRSASTKAASAKSASSRKAVNSTNTRASSRSTATRTKAGSSRPRASHKVADAR